MEDQGRSKETQLGVYQPIHVVIEREEVEDEDLVDDQHQEPHYGRRLIRLRHQFEWRF